MYKVILLSDFAEEYGKNLLKGIAKYSRDHGPWTFCRMPAYYRDTIGIDGIIDWAREWKADGIIGQFYNNQETEKIRRAKLPVIAQDFKERLKGVPNITGAYHETGRMAAEYFLKKGFRNFAFYGFRNIVWSRERAEGFRDRVAEAGYEVHMYERTDSRATDLWHYKPSTLTRWLKSLPKPCALLSCDDNLGNHITEAARHTGIKIPDQLAVMGVDNDEMLCELSDPPLSSIKLDTEKSGYEAARLLHAMIEGKDQDQIGDIVVQPTQVVSRVSTDIFASEDKYIVEVLRYIDENLDKNLKVNEVLKEVPMSRRSLEKRFVMTTGYPVYEYIYNKRIEKFTQKLLETDMTIYEIALDLGLSDSKNIARQFKQLKGLTPVAYRKKYMLQKR